MRNRIRLHRGFLFFARPFRDLSLTRKTMQSLRSTGVRRLCLSVTASVTRRAANPLFPALACLRQSFTSSPTRWYSSTDQLHHQVTKETGGETPREAEKATRCARPRPFAVRSLTNSSSKVKWPTGTLYLGNLPYSVTEDDLQEMLSVYGPLTRVAIGLSQNLHPHTCFRNDHRVLTCSPKPRVPRADPWGSPT